MLRQGNLTAPAGILPTGRLRGIGHAQMTDGNPQPRTLADHLAELAHLTVAVLEGDAQHHIVLLHQTEHLHHLVAGQGLSQEPMTGDGDASEAALQNQRLSLRQEIRLPVVGHAAAEETVGILALHLFQIVVLQAVDKLLHHHSRTHLGVVHVREEHLGRIPAVEDKRRHHLHLLAEEDAPFRPSSCPASATNANARLLSSSQYIFLSHTDLTDLTDFSILRINLRHSLLPTIICESSGSV